MKNALFVILLLSLVSCSQVMDDEIKSEKNINETEILYENAIIGAQGVISNICMDLCGSNTRSTTTQESLDELLTYLLAQPMNVLDSMFVSMNTPEIINQRETIEENIKNSFEENTTSEEAQKVVEFFYDYYNMGGNNMEYVSNVILDMSSYAKQCVVIEAVWIDQIIEFGKSYRVRVNRECWDRLMIGLAGLGITSEIGSAVAAEFAPIPPASVVIAAAMATWDSVDAIRLAFDYERCTAIL